VLFSTRKVKDLLTNFKGKLWFIKLSLQLQFNLNILNNNKSYKPSSSLLMMEKDIGKIQKNEIVDIVIRVDDFGGRPGVTIREFMNGDRYTGFTKNGTKIPLEKFGEFKDLINSINEEVLEEAKKSVLEQQEQQPGQVDEGQETL